MMAFGAGALLFAVSVEMFAKALTEVHEEDGDTLMAVTVVMSIVGAVLYIILNRLLSGSSHGGSHVSHHRSNMKDRLLRAAEAVHHAGEILHLPGVHRNPMLALSDEEDAENPKAPSPKGDSMQSEVALEVQLSSVDEVQHEMAEMEEDAALSIWLGIAIDGVPESMMVGFMAAEDELSIAFIIAVFLANFPEALSSSALMVKHGDSSTKIFMMWMSLCIGTGTLAAITAALTPSRHVGSFEQRVSAAAAEGLAGGSMMACISTAMLPEGFEEGGDFAGLATMLGFLASLMVKVLFEDHEIMDHCTTASYSGITSSAPRPSHSCCGND